MNEWALSNDQLQIAIIEAGKIVMGSTDKTTSGEARQHAADFLKKAFDLQVSRAMLIFTSKEEVT